MPSFGIFHKNKRVVRFHRYSRIFGAIFLLAVICLPLFSGLTRAADVPVRSVTISSEHTNYINNEPGSWNITKSAEWIDAGKARITFEVESVAKYDESKNLDVLMVIDNSGSMSGEKMNQVKTDATDLVNVLLSDSNNRVALVTFESSAQIISGFTNNKTEMINHIESIATAGCTNYNQGYIKALEVLDGYTQRENADLIMLFLTDGAPNEEVSNEIAQYETLKALYPYMTINGIQYEMGDMVLQPIINVSDYQYIATMTDLNNVLFEATITPYTYDNFVITDYIDNAYWNVTDVSAINASLGAAALAHNGSTPVVTWDMSGAYRSGSKQTLTIDINLKNELINEDLLLPTNTHETVESSILDTPDEDIDSDLTPILKSTYDVIYDANAPSDCGPAGAVPATTSHTVFSTVGISDNSLSCSGYNFNGWQSDINENNKINDDYFKMPERDVTFKAIWSKPSISKTMDGDVHIKAIATFGTGQNVNAKLKRLSGQSNASYSTQNSTITAIEKANTLSASVDTSDSAYIVSASDSMAPIYAWYDEGTIYYYTNAEEIYLNKNASDMFYELRGVASIEGVEEWIAVNTTNMQRMFSYAGYSATTWSVEDLSGWDTSSVTTMDHMFSYAGYSATTWSVEDLSGWDTSSVTNMSYMFYYAGYKATTWSVDLSGWDTSSVTGMNSMFADAGYNATTWSVGDLSGWDTSSVTNMSYMFYYAGYKATTWSVGDLSSWDTSKVTSMDSMFSSAGHSATTWSIGDLSSWDTSKVTSMTNMFHQTGYSATTWSVGDLSSWDTSNVMSMASMFSGAGRNASTWSVGDLSSWDTSIVTSMVSMFSSAGYNATTWSIGDLSNWDTSSVTNMASIFNHAAYSATSFSLDLSDWDTSSVTSMSDMFREAGYSATTWSVGDLSSWDTSSVTNMSYMFYYTGYSATTWSVGDLSNWNTSNVTDTYRMFYCAGYSSASFSLDLSGWDTSSVTDMSYMFSEAGYSATTWSVGDLSSWDTSNVTNMSYIFYYTGYKATTWSVGDLSGWDTSSVTNMSSMFYYAGYYSATTWSVGDLSSWDTSSATSMYRMFCYAGYSSVSFSLDLSGWDTSSVTNMSGMFYNAGYSATTWSVTIPATNGAGIENTTSAMYGNSTSVYASLNNARSFTLATP